jgi:hypothetical protein
MVWSSMQCLIAWPKILDLILRLNRLGCLIRGRRRRRRFVTKVRLLHRSYVGNCPLTEIYSLHDILGAGCTPTFT